MVDVGNQDSGTPGRVALVMAASKGLGRGCAEALGNAGYRLMLCARNQDGLDDVVGSLRERNVEVTGVAADVSQPSELERVFTTMDDTYGRLDVLVANAGGPPPGTFLRVTEEQWVTAFNLTLMSAVRAMQMAIPRMQKASHGRLVAIGSSSVKQPIPGLVLSNAFRPALLGVVKTLSQELAPEGITVNMVSPGRIDTDRVRTLDENRAREQSVSYEQIRSQSEQTIPARRYGAPGELGSLVAFLASPEAGYITGQSILVDGGMVSAL